MNRRFLLGVVLLALLICAGLPRALATSNHHYAPGEYAVVNNGLSPNNQYSIAAHGEGEDGYDNFHIYLMDAPSGKKIGPLEEIKGTLDTGADAFDAQWSPDSHEVSITYRVDRHAAVSVRYRIANRRAYLMSGPAEVSGLPR